MSLSALAADRYLIISILQHLNRFNRLLHVGQSYLLIVFLELVASKRRKIQLTQ